MTLPLHLVKLTHGRYLNLVGVTALVARDDTVKVWYTGEDGHETFTGDDVTIIVRRLNALAFLATDGVEQGLHAVPLPPGADRPRA